VAHVTTEVFPPVGLAIGVTSDIVMRLAPVLESSVHGGGASALHEHVPGVAVEVLTGQAQETARDGEQPAGGDLVEWRLPAFLARHASAAGPHPVEAECLALDGVRLARALTMSLVYLLP
jgi:hypothetical protein